MAQTTKSEWKQKTAAVEDWSTIGPEWREKKTLALTRKYWRQDTQTHWRAVEYLNRRKLWWSNEKEEQRKRKRPVDKGKRTFEGKGGKRGEAETRVRKKQWIQTNWDWMAKLGSVWCLKRKKTKASSEKDTTATTETSARHKAYTRQCTQCRHCCF